MGLWKTLAIMLVCIGRMAPSYADTLVLKDGDTLSGKLVTIADQTVLFKTSIAGQMMVPADEVMRISTASNVQVTLADGNQITGRFQMDNDTARLTSDNGAEHKLRVADIATITPLPSPKLASSEPVPIKGSLETGVQWREGTKNYSDLFDILTLSKDTEKYAFASRVWLERADAHNFPRFFLADATWKRAPNAKIYPVMGIALERDTANALGLRANANIGVGGRLWESENSRLETAAALDAETATWDSKYAYNEGIDGARGYDKHDRQQLNLRLTLRYSRALFQNGRFDESLDFYPSLTHLGELRARSESSLMFLITEQLGVRLNLLFDYQDNPEFQYLQNWRTTVGASLRWDF